MKKATLLIFVFLIPFAASAQNWTAEQQEVIDFIKSCWDAWGKAFEQKDFDIHAQSCPFDEDAAYWMTDAGAPSIGQADQIRGHSLGLFAMLWGKGNWLDLRPLSVKIVGDVALVHFYAVFIWEDAKGEVSQIEEKRFEVFQKRDGQWIVIGGMVTPVLSK